MIKTHRKLSLLDLSGKKKDVDVEVNWNKVSANCKYIRLSIGKEKAVVLKEHLWSLMLLLTEGEQQEKLVPTVQVPVSHYATRVSVIAKKPIAKGELIVFPLSVSVNKSTGQMMVKA